jgi:hypothetical protein
MSFLVFEKILPEKAYKLDAAAIISILKVRWLEG